jgi:FlaA1/EpsC-like NDP-sugar epimerase
MIKKYKNNLINILERTLHYRRIFIAMFHMLCFALAYILAFILRFEGNIPSAFYELMLKTILLIVFIQGVIFYFHDLYHGLWRYVSFEDTLNILRATLISMIIFMFLNLIFSPYLGIVPRSIYILDGLLVVGLTCGSRFLVRHLRHSFQSSIEQPEAKRVVLVAPVDEAEPLLREMMSRSREYIPLALVDPTNVLSGSRILDIPIIAGFGNITETVKRYRAKEMILAWPDGNPDQVNDLIAECKQLQIQFKIIPTLNKLLEGHYRLADLRDIELEDLLPRPPIYIDRENLEKYIRNRIVLISGAGGSIGSELCQQIARFGATSLIILDRAENSLYKIEMELRRRFPEVEIHPLVASINDGPGLEIILKQYRPHLVFHAAAYKQVPLMERFPIEAAYNNILGTRNLAWAAMLANVERFVMISTDKAVNPTSVMGVTKRIAEKYVQACNNGSHSIRFITTRFGNVLGSAGSVIPLFKDQLAQGGPLTVTHPEIERFFMTIPEAVQLVLQAACMGKGGDIFVLKMGRPVKIRDLAEKLIMLSGKTPGTDVPLCYTGLRPGEKLYEELFNEDEQQLASSHPMIDYAVGPKRSLEELEPDILEIQQLVHSRERERLIKKFKELIGNYQESSFLGKEPKIVN